MKKPWLFLFLITSPFIHGQNNTEFSIKIIDRAKSEFAPYLHSFESNADDFYEDDDYMVTTNCQGEFGGNITFLNKITNFSYDASIQCATSIIKRYGKYYVTASLSHGNGKWGFYEIADPSKLKISDIGLTYKSDAVEADLMRPDLNVLWKSGGTVLLTFLYDNDFHFIISKDENIILQRFHNGTLNNLKLLLKKKLFYVSNDLNLTVNQIHRNRFFYFDNGQTLPGTVSVNGNDIEIILFK